MQSGKRFEKQAVYRTELANSVNPEQPVTDFQQVDASTVRVKLARPDALTMPLRGQSLGGVWIQPTEGISGKFDFANELHSSGPFLLEKYQRSMGFSFIRNPNWHIGEGKRPYLGGINITIIPDTAQAEAQFRAKNLHYDTISPENMVLFAKELKDTHIVKSPPAVSGPYWGMSWLPSQP